MAKNIWIKINYVAASSYRSMERGGRKELESDYKIGNASNIFKYLTIKWRDRGVTHCDTLARVCIKL